MPAYRCEDCGDMFRRKDALTDHRETCSGETHETAYDDMKAYVSGIDISASSFSPRRLRNMFTLRNMGIMFGVLMMATLFLGTASFMTQTAPSSGAGPTGAATAESNPALGYSVRSAQDVPRLSGSDQPDPISRQPLNTDQQLWVITQGGQEGVPGILIHYNCETQCPELEQNLAQFAQTFNGWVYITPNPELNAKIAATGFQRIDRSESFDQEGLQNFVCSTYQRLQVSGPIECVTG